MEAVELGLKKFFAWLGFKSEPGCNCEKRQLTYDEMGVDWCEEHQTEIVNEILEEAKRRKIALPQYASRLFIAGIVKICIKRAKNV